MDKILDIKTEPRYVEALKCLEHLENAGFEARLAGGCVRDFYLKMTPKDFDIATSALPEQTSSIFKQKGMKVVPTGIDHGTVTVVGKFGVYEVTTLRKDINTDGRHAQVEFGFSFEEDAARRDFTMNAMFLDRQGQIYDYFLGRKHLEAKELHFVGDARQRIQEDYLRILRMYRFWARYGCTPNEQTLQAVTEIGAGLVKISQERITSELLGLLQSNNPEKPLDHLFSSQIASMLLADGIKLNQQELTDSQKIPEYWRGVIRLGLLLKTVHDRKHIERICQRLKLSNLHLTIILSVLLGLDSLEDSSSQSDLMTAIDRCESIEKDVFLKAIVISWEIIHTDKAKLINRMKQIEETKNHVRKAALPVSSKDLMLKFNLIPGPELGRCLTILKESFRNEEWMDKDAGIAWLETKRETNKHD